MSRAALAYFLHLAVPLALLVDRIVARTNGFVSSYNLALIVAAAVWLAAGGGFYVRSRDRNAFLRGTANPLLAFYTLLVCLALGEAVAWLVASGRVYSRRDHVFPPFSRYEINPDPRDMPGVSGKSVYTVNNLGLRGPPPPASGAYRMITIGGSTTECVYLDDSEEWPGLTMRTINAAGPPRAAWIANAGMSGHTTVHHLYFLESARVLRETDMWIFLTGINDLSITLTAGGDSTGAQLQRSAANLFDARFVYGHLFILYAGLDRSLLYELATLAAGFEPGSGVRHTLRGWYGRRRAVRARAAIRPLPSLETGLSEYAVRLERLFEQCRRHGKRCLFLTQPTMWRSDLPPDLMPWLWFGRVRDGFADASDLAAAMDRYNQTLLDRCRKKGMECLDIAPALPKDLSSFFDDCHFTENGSRLVAQAVANYLLSKPPFVGAQ
ncbi:MAG: SGNH/GDSL hydrolase family protein [Acidobacteria bacterium]|nr:SGNH/GDSL hydrolase family protein [Acidobacteriota bacterium]